MKLYFQKDLSIRAYDYQFNLKLGAFGFLGLRLKEQLQKGVQQYHTHGNINYCFFILKKNYIMPYLNQ